MSTTYFSWTYPIATGLVASAALKALQDAAQDEVLCDASRSDWYLGTVESMIRSHAPETLRFLDHSRAERLADDAGYPWSISVLTVDQVRPALIALEQLLQGARDDPAGMQPYFGSYGSTEADVREAISFPKEVDGDEGQGPSYLFAHLERLLGLLRRACDAGLAIAHIRYLNE